MSIFHPTKKLCYAGEFLTFFGGFEGICLRPGMLTAHRCRHFDGYNICKVETVFGAYCGNPNLGFFTHYTVPYENDPGVRTCNECTSVGGCLTGYLD